jgi:hypothetical protein
VEGAVTALSQAVGIRDVSDAWAGWRRGWVGIQPSAPVVRVLHPHHHSSRVQDFIEKYMLSEKDKFGRDVTREEAEKEIDAWLLRSAVMRTHVGWSCIPLVEWVLRAECVVMAIGHSAPSRQPSAMLRRKATFAPQQTTSTDLALAIAVFIVTFGSGLFLSR